MKHNIIPKDLVYMDLCWHFAAYYAK